LKSFFKDFTFKNFFSKRRAFKKAQPKNINELLKKLNQKLSKKEIQSKNRKKKLRKI
jgi:uncharacterized protein with von Willebrand factor type A (vWA) domain